MAINFGAVVGPLLCGALAQAFGWHVGFGIAAVFWLLIRVPEPQAPAAGKNSAFPSMMSTGLQSMMPSPSTWFT